MTSPRTVDRLARILAMVPWVIENPGSTVDDLCTRFGATREEVLKDLELVVFCGLPGYGPGDLIDVDVWDDEVEIDMAGYFSRPLRLTAVEALAMLAGAMAMQSAGADDPTLSRAVEKLAAVLLPEEGLVDVALRSEPDLVTLLRTAAGNHEVVHLTYTGLASGETTDRDVEPWLVFSSLGNWYLVGHCRLADGERSFRVDRIRAADTTGERFPPPEQLPEPEAAYSPGADDAIVEIALSSAASWVAEYYPVSVIEADGDGMTIEFRATDVEVIARLMLRLGPEAKIVGGVDGDSARDAARRMRGRMLARYE